MTSFGLEGETLTLAEAEAFDKLFGGGPLTQKQADILYNSQVKPQERIYEKEEMPSIDPHTVDVSALTDAEVMWHYKWMLANKPNAIPITQREAFIPRFYALNLPPPSKTFLMELPLPTSSHGMTSPKGDYLYNFYSQNLKSWEQLKPSQQVLLNRIFKEFSFGLLNLSDPSFGDIWALSKDDLKMFREHYEAKRETLWNSKGEIFQKAFNGALTNRGYEALSVTECPMATWKKVAIVGSIALLVVVGGVAFSLLGAAAVQSGDSTTPTPSPATVTPTPTPVLEPIFYCDNGDSSFVSDPFSLMCPAPLEIKPLVENSDINPQVFEGRQVEDLTFGSAVMPHPDFADSPTEKLFDARSLKNLKWSTSIVSQEDNAAALEQARNRAENRKQADTPSTTLYGTLGGVTHEDLQPLCFLKDKPFDNTTMLAKDIEVLTGFQSKPVAFSLLGAAAVQSGDSTTPTPVLEPIFYCDNGDSSFVSDPFSLMCPAPLEIKPLVEHAVMPHSDFADSPTERLFDARSLQGFERGTPIVTQEDHAAALRRARARAENRKQADTPSTTLYGTLDGVTHEDLQPLYFPEDKPFDNTTMFKRDFEVLTDLPTVSEIDPPIKESRPIGTDVMPHPDFANSPTEKLFDARSLQGLEQETQSSFQAEKPREKQEYSSTTYLAVAATIMTSAFAVLLTAMWKRRKAQKTEELSLITDSTPVGEDRRVQKLYQRDFLRLLEQMVIAFGRGSSRDDGLLLSDGEGSTLERVSSSNDERLNRGLKKFLRLIKSANLSIDGLLSGKQSLFLELLEGLPGQFNLGRMVYSNHELGQPRLLGPSENALQVFSQPQGVELSSLGGRSFGKENIVLNIGELLRQFSPNRLHSAPLYEDPPVFSSRTPFSVLNIGNGSRNTVPLEASSSSLVVPREEEFKEGKMPPSRFFGSSSLSGGRGLLDSLSSLQTIPLDLQHYVKVSPGKCDALSHDLNRCGYQPGGNGASPSPQQFIKPSRYNAVTVIQDDLSAQSFRKLLAQACAPDNTIDYLKIVGNKSDSAVVWQLLCGRIKPNTHVKTLDLEGLGSVNGQLLQKLKATFPGVLCFNLNGVKVEGDISSVGADHLIFSEGKSNVEFHLKKMHKAIEARFKTTTVVDRFDGIKQIFRNRSPYALHPFGLARLYVEDLSFLKGLDITDDEIERILPGIRSNFPFVRELDLSDCKLLTVKSLRKISEFPIERLVLRNCERLSMRYSGTAGAFVADAGNALKSVEKGVSQFSGNVRFLDIRGSIIFDPQSALKGERDKYNKILGLLAKAVESPHVKLSKVIWTHKTDGDKAFG